MSDSPDDILGLTAGIVAAYVSRQAVSAADLPGLMRTVRDGLARLIHRALSAVVFRLMASGIARLF